MTASSSFVNAKNLVERHSLGCVNICHASASLCNTSKQSPRSSGASLPAAGLPTAVLQTQGAMSLALVGVCAAVEFMAPVFWLFLLVAGLSLTVLTTQVVAWPVTLVR